MGILFGFSITYVLLQVWHHLFPKNSKTFGDTHREQLDNYSNWIETVERDYKDGKIDRNCLIVELNCYHRYLQCATDPCHVNAEQLSQKTVERIRELQCVE